MFKMLTAYPICRVLPLKHRQYESGRSLANSLLRAETLLLSAESIQVGRDTLRSRRRAKSVCHMDFKT